MFTLRRIRPRGKTAKRNDFRRRCRTEILEPRNLLAPLVSSVLPSLTEGKLAEGATSLKMSFSEAVSGADLQDNYQLRGMGADGLLGTDDDNLVTLAVSYNAPAATLSFAALPEGVFRITVRDNIMDLSGNRLDGDGDGSPGGDWVREFVVNGGAGMVDPGFGQSGRANLPFILGDGYQAVQSFAVQSDGKIVAVGSSENGSHLVFAVARYNTNGSLDATFSSDGKLTTSFGPLDSEAADVAIQPDGKIVVVGYANNGGNTDFAVARYNADGSPDTAFSNDGKLTTPIGTGYDEARSMALQSDGKIVVAGYSSKGTHSDFALARYNTDGSLDATFDGDGKLTTSISSLDDYAYSVAIQSDGKIVAAGYSDNGTDYDFALTRYNANGSLDTTFDGDGKLTTAIGAFDDYASSVAIQSDGKIVAAGCSDNGTDYDFALARYNANGSLDTTFHSTGIVTTAFGTSDDVGYSVAIQADGKIVVAGYSDVGSAYYNFALARYNANGNLDATFDGDGKLTTSFGPLDDKAYSVAVLSGGKILAAGYSNNGNSSDFALARYNANGGLDTTFDGDGKLTTAFGWSDDVGYGLASQSDGKLVVAGRSSNGTNDDFAVARYDADGSLDASFDGDGKLTTAIGASDDRATSVAIQADGKIVVAGYSVIETVDGSSYDFALARYNVNGSLDATFGGTGKVTTFIGDFDDVAYSVAIQPDGKIVVAGYSDNGSNYNFALVRYNANGSLDTTFGGTGKVTTSIGARDDVAHRVVIQADGKIVVAGRSFNGTNYDFALARYNANGTLDTTFDGDGKLTTAVGAADDFAWSVAIQADGRVLVAGYSDNGTNYDFALVRYNANGALDATFDGDGKLTTSFGAYDDFARSVAIQADGRIIVAGGTDNGTNHYDFALARYNADGSLDTTFDGDGKLTGALGASDEIAFSAALQSDGKIVVAGTMSLPDPMCVVARYLATGDLPFATPGARSFDIDVYGQGAGQLVEGTGNAFDGLNRLRVAGTDFAPPGTPALDDGGRTALTAEQTLAGLVVHREITVPIAGAQDFARTIDVFQNPGTSPITAEVRILGNLGSDAATSVFATSDGDANVETSDQWIGTDDGDGTGTPAIIHYVSGPAGLRPTSVLASGDNIEWTYSLTVPAGQTVRLAYFTIAATTRAEAEAAAAALVTSAGFGAEAAAFLTPEEVASLANMQFSQANRAPTDVGLSSSTIAENLPINTAVGTLSATDPDLPDDAHTFSLVPGAGDTDNALFKTNGDQLQTDAVFNFEAKASYSVRVRATDRAGASVEKAFTISVLDLIEVFAVSAEDWTDAGLTLTLGGDGKLHAYRTNTDTNVDAVPPHVPANVLSVRVAGRANPADVLTVDTLPFLPGGLSYAGGGALVKAGPGTLELSEANAYQGGTTVTQGTLVVANSNAWPYLGSMTIGSGATLVLGSNLNGAAVSAALPESTTATVLATTAPVAASAEVVQANSSPSPTAAGSAPLAPETPPSFAVQSLPAGAVQVALAVSPGVSSKAPTVESPIAARIPGPLAMPRFVGSVKLATGAVHRTTPRAKANDAVLQSAVVRPHPDLAWEWAAGEFSARKRSSRTSDSSLQAVDQVLASGEWSGAG
jgi:uncharacterized delta-60 repeat protein